jgi:hypothetical protein
MHAFFLRILSCHCQDFWGMDIKFEDGNGLTSDPVSPEIRSSPQFQNTFLTLHTRTLEKLQAIKATTLYHLAVDCNIWVKGKKHVNLMNVLTKYVILIRCTVHDTAY